MAPMRDPASVFHALIPGGSHTYSKGDDQFPSNAPKTIERGDGAYVWDAQNTQYIDWTMGLRSVTLGYGCKDIDDVAVHQLRKGSSFSRPSSVEFELAQEIVDLIPSIDMVKFGKNGSTSNTAALRLARAFTGRKYIAYCKDHPFFSFDDWFIGKTPCNNGIPEEHYALSLPFEYNNIQSLETLFETYKGQIAGVIMEAATTNPDTQACGDFLKKVEALCRQEESLFILDEVITGFRWHLKGAQTYFGVTPDLTTFGKGIANGYSVSVLGGRRDVMDLGGITHTQKRLFLMSTTYGAEAHSLAAALATIRFYQKEPVVDHLWAIGSQLIEGMNAIASTLGIQDYFFATGYGCRPEYVCKNKEKEICLKMRTLFLQEMIKHGVILNYIVPSYAHNDHIVQKTLDAIQLSLSVYKKALESDVHLFLEGPAIKPVFREYN